MIVKIYALIWVVGIAAAAAFYVTGNLGPVSKNRFWISDLRNGFYGNDRRSAEYGRS